MQVTINGEQQNVDATTIDALLVAMSVPLDRVAVEHNGTVLRRQARADAAIRDGDVIEIVTLVGGG
jgi:sulfur carrier protein